MIPGSDRPRSDVRGPKSRNGGISLFSVPESRTSDIGRWTLDQTGFTLVEVMIVLVVIGILVTLATPSFTTSVHRAREAALRENLFVLRDVIDQHYADNGTYPPALEALVEKRYLRKIPKDPITGSESTWILVPDTDEHGVEVGIFDVKSGSDQAAMDGTQYNAW